MLFARWQHHIWFDSGFPYTPLKAMLTKISKWSRIQDYFRITPKIEPLVVFAIPDIPRKFQKDPSITFWVILLTQTDRQTKSSKNITSLAEVKMHSLNWTYLQYDGHTIVTQNCTTPIGSFSIFDVQLICMLQIFLPPLLYNCKEVTGKCSYSKQTNT